jgi:hypothetical protein
MDEALVLHIKLWLKSKAANEISTVEPTLYHVASKDQPNNMLLVLLSLEAGNSSGFSEIASFILSRRTQRILKVGWCDETRELVLTIGGLGIHAAGALSK